MGHAVPTLEDYFPLLLCLVFYSSYTTAMIKFALKAFRYFFFKRK